MKKEYNDIYNKHDQGMNCQRFVFVCVYRSSSRIAFCLSNKFRNVSHLFAKFSSSRQNAI